MYLSFIQCPLSFFTYANNFFTSCCLYWESIFCLVNKKCENELAHGHGTLNPRNDNKVVCINSRLGLPSKSIEFYREKVALVEEERLWQAGGWQNYTYGVDITFESSDLWVFRPKRMQFYIFYFHQVNVKKCYFLCLWVIIY